MIQTIIKKYAKQTVIFGCAGIWALLFAAGLAAYTGSALVYALFSVIFLSVLLCGLLKPVSYGYFFLAAFTWLGFWVKLTSHLILKYPYTEAVGAFDGSPGSWDGVLLVASVAGCGMIIAKGVYALFGKPTVSLNVKAGPPAWHIGKRKSMWQALMFGIILLAAFNSFFGIHQLSLYPKTVFPWPTNWAVAWMLNIGAAMAVTTLVYWDARAKKNIFWPLVAIIAEAFVSTVSVLSRGTFLFHAVPVLIAALKNRFILAGLSRIKIFLCCVIFVASFILSLGIVGMLRDYYYSDATSKSASRTELHMKNFWAICSVKSLIVRASRQVTGLAVDRWIGLEGVMAVNSYPGKNMALLIAGLRERRHLGVIPIYERICNSHYQNLNRQKYQFATVSGGAAFFYYSGSLWAVLFGLFLLSFLVLAFEGIIGYLTGNPFLCSLIGMSAANFAAQFGTDPIQMSYSFAMMFLASAFLWMLERKTGASGPSGENIK